MDIQLLIFGILVTISIQCYQVSFRNYINWCNSRWCECYLFKISIKGRPVRRVFELRGWWPFAQSDGAIRCVSVRATLSSVRQCVCLCECVSEHMCACIFTPSPSGWLSPVLFYQKLLWQCAPVYLCVCVWGYLRRTTAVLLTWSSFYHSHCLQSEMVPLNSLGSPLFDLETCNYPAISMGLNPAVLFASHPLPSGSLLCFSIVPEWIFVFVFVILFICVCVYSLHFTAARVRHREGRGWRCIVDGTECSCGCMNKGGGDYFEYVFRQGKEENPRVEVVGVEGTLANEGHVF